MSTTATAAKTLPPRSDVPAADQWDLSSLFGGDADWEAAFTVPGSGQLDGYAKFRGKLADSAEMISALMQFDAAVERAAERLGNYAFLKHGRGPGGQPDYQRMQGPVPGGGDPGRRGWPASPRPELMAIDPADVMARLPELGPELEPWRLALDRTLRYRPHTLGPKEEQLLAMQGQMSRSASEIFRQLSGRRPEVAAGRRTSRGESGRARPQQLLSAFLHSARAAGPPGGPRSTRTTRPVRGAQERHRRGPERQRAEGRLLRPGPRVHRSARRSRRCSTTTCRSACTTT